MTVKKGNSILAIIPARGGSIGIVRKNIQVVAGKPLIAYTIDAAAQSKLLSRVVVSTDDPEIAAVAREHGADVPFLRPTEMATDEVSVYPALSHAVLWLEEQEGWQPDYVMLLQPTSPLRTCQDIDSAIQLALDTDADSVVSLCETKLHPYWTKTVTREGHIVDFIQLDEPIHRRQHLPPVYALNGSIYLVKRAILVERETFYTDRTLAYIMPASRSLDVDTPWDLELVSLVLADRELQSLGV